MYLYVPSTLAYRYMMIFYLIWYGISLLSEGYIRAHTEECWVHT
jgi:hypothetical protein